MITIENKTLKAGFSLKGAELQSLRNIEKDIEYIWDGNPEFWGKHSPVLFPIVGGLKDNTYYIDGTEYNLPRHGFARDREFEAETISDTEVAFTLAHDDQTLKSYPFEFSLRLHYKLTDSGLTCTYQVSNPAPQPLLFSIGSHPAFATPVGDDLRYEDYVLHFNNDDKITYHKIKDDLIDDETVSIDLVNGTLQLSHELFYNDALVFKSLKSDRITLRNSKNDHGIHYEFENFPYFGIWAAKNADFICLEAWCGIADGINHNQHLVNKEGIMTLANGQRWERSWTIDCF